MAGSGAVMCAEEPGNAQANLWAHPAQQISSQAGDCIEMAPWQREEARTWPWVSGEPGCFCGGLSPQSSPLSGSSCSVHSRRTTSAIKE